LCFYQQETLSFTSSQNVCSTIPVPHTGNKTCHIALCTFKTLLSHATCPSLSKTFPRTPSPRKNACILWLHDQRMKMLDVSNSAGLKLNKTLYTESAVCVCLNIRPVAYRPQYYTHRCSFCNASLRWCGLRFNASKKYGSVYLPVYGLLCKKFRRRRVQITNGRVLLLTTPLKQQTKEVNILTWYVVRPSWEAYCSWASQEMVHALRNPKVYHRVHKIPLLVTIMSQMNPIHILTFYLFKIHFNIIPHLCVLPSLQVFSMSVSIYHLHAYYMPRPSHLS
jgi:hypothetical protein